MPSVKNIAVYLGSSCGKDSKFMDFAREFGSMLARKGFTTVYGGANVGTMAALADGVLAAGGEIIGVFPKGFGGKREVAMHRIDVARHDLTKMIEVKDFSERKEVLEEISDCAVVLPGSFGSMDEMFCYAVGNEIARHDKKVYVINLDGYYDGLKALISSFKENGFLAKDASMIEFCDSAEEFFGRIS